LPHTPGFAHRSFSVGGLRRLKSEGGDLVVLDLLARMVFLLVQRLLLLFSQVTMVLGSHIPFFMSDLVVFMVQFGGFGLTHLTICHFMVDAFVLVSKAVINFSAPGMLFGPFSILG
jgi:hypothetical protein